VAAAGRRGHDRLPAPRRVPPAQRVGRVRHERLLQRVGARPERVGGGGNDGPGKQLEPLPRPGARCRPGPGGPHAGRRRPPLGGGIDVARWPVHERRSLYWEGLNRGKRSVTLDLRSERGRQVAARLAADAGTVLTNLPTRGPLAYERLVEQRPDLVMLAISG